MRDGFLIDAQGAELGLAPILLGEAHTSKRRVNPRLLARSKAEKQMPLLMDAIELSKLPDAPEDKKSDYDFEQANQPGGPVEQFYKYNSPPHGRDKDPKFIANEDLLDAWKDYVSKNPMVPPLPKKAPWRSATNRKTGLKIMLTSSVPSAFKNEILRATGFM